MYASKQRNVLNVKVLNTCTNEIELNFLLHRYCFKWLAKKYKITINLLGVVGGGGSNRVCYKFIQELLQK